jgi:RNA polymerase sigma factor (TIGR02999 family)
VSGHKPQQVTMLLSAWRGGSADAQDRLFQLVYEDLRRLASRYMARERPGHTLQATALVHEAYIRLIGAEEIDWQDHAHFFAVAARVMRHILVDRARPSLSEERRRR